MSELVDTHSKLYVQKICGVFHYYTIAVDQTMLVALNNIATAGAQFTTATMINIL